MARYHEIPPATDKRLPITPVLHAGRAMNGTQCDACTAVADVTITGGYRQLGAQRIHGATIRLCGHCAAILSQRIVASISHGP